MKKISPTNKILLSNYFMFGALLLGWLLNELLGNFLFFIVGFILACYFDVAYHKCPFCKKHIDHRSISSDGFCCPHCGKHITSDNNNKPPKL